MIDLNDFPSAEWNRAIAFFDDGDPSKVAELLLSGEPQSLHVRQFLAKVVTGERKPPMVGKARRVLTIDHLRMLGQYVSIFRLVDPTSFMAELEGEELEAAKWWLATGRRNLKNEGIARVAALSGASVGTVRQAWKKLAAPMERIKRRNKAFERAQQAPAPRIYRGGKLYTPRVR